MNNSAKWHKPIDVLRRVENAYAIRPSGAIVWIVRYWRHEMMRRVNAMRMLVLSGVLGAALLAGCVGTPSLQGSMGAPSFTALQEMCAASPVDYGTDAQSVYSAFFDAYVAQRRGGLSKERFCAFQAGIAERHRAYRENPGPEAQSAWTKFFLDQRAQALSWRATVDPTLRAG
jgi:hypothetical protein